MGVLLTQGLMQLGCEAAPRGAVPLPFAQAALSATAQVATDAVALTSVPTPSSTALPTARPQLAELPPKLQLEGEVGCSWSTAAFSPRRGGTTLALGQQGPIFARLVSGDIRVSVPQGESSFALVEARSGGVVLSGFAQMSSFEFSAARGFAMGSVLIPGPRAKLKVLRSKDANVTVQITAPSEVALAKAELEETRPCTDLAIEEGRFDPAAAIFDTSKGRASVLTAGPLPLSRSSAGPIELTLKVGEFGGNASAFEDRHQRTLIAWPVSDVVIFGWVPSTRVQRSQSAGIGLGRGTSRITDPKQPDPIAFAVCETDIPLIAELDGQEKTVGHVVRGTPIGVLEWQEPRSTVLLETAGFRRIRGQISVRTAEIGECRGVPAEERSSLP